MHDIFYFTDVHGCYDLYRAAINYCMEQDSECTIIYGGDACDRGEHGYQIMKELIANPQVGYLKGNHEDMFINAAIAIQQNYNSILKEENIAQYLYQCFENGTDKAVYLALNNGGFSTIRDWMLDGMPDNIITRLIHLPVTFSYNNIDFCHAGGRYKEFKRVAEAEYNEEWPDSDDEWFLIWDRNYLGHGWETGRTCIFGHTPTPHIARKYYGGDKSLANAHPCSYVATLDDKYLGRKIDMDTGAFASGKLYILNVLTMQAQGFHDLDLGNDEISKHRIEKIEVIQC